MQHNKMRKQGSTVYSKLCMTFGLCLGLYYFHLNVVPKLGMLTNCLYLMYFVLNFLFLIKTYIIRTTVLSMSKKITRNVSMSS